MECLKEGSVKHGGTLPTSIQYLASAGALTWCFIDPIKIRAQRIRKSFLLWKKKKRKIFYDDRKVGIVEIVLGKNKKWLRHATWIFQQESCRIVDSGSINERCLIHRTIDYIERSTYFAFTLFCFLLRGCKSYLQLNETRKGAVSGEKKKKNETYKDYLVIDRYHVPSSLRGSCIKFAFQLWLH